MRSKTLLPNCSSTNPLPMIPWYLGYTSEDKLRHLIAFLSVPKFWGCFGFWRHGANQLLGPDYFPKPEVLDVLLRLHSFPLQRNHVQLPANQTQTSVQGCLALEAFGRPVHEQFEHQKNRGSFFFDFLGSSYLKNLWGKQSHRFGRNVWMNRS